MKHSNSIITSLRAKKTQALSGLRKTPAHAYPRVTLSKIGNFISGFNVRAPEHTGSGHTRTVETPRTGSAPGSHGGSRTGGAQEAFDQKAVDSKVEGFEGAGHSSGTRQPGDAPEVKAPDTPEMEAYKAKHQKEWQTRKKDAETREKLFGQEKPGQVNGKDVEPYSSQALERNADELVKADAKVKETSLPPATKTMLKTAGINSLVGVPFTIVALGSVGTFNESLKPHINPAPVPATAKSVEEERLVDQAQKSVFTVVNTLASLRGEEHVEPGVKWVAQTKDERLDSLETMVEYAEGQFAVEAQKYGIPFQLPSKGADKDDVKSRVVAIEARLAALSALMSAIKAKLAA